MIFVILVIALIMFFAGCVLWDKYDHDTLGMGMTIGGAVIAVISIFALVALICNVSGGSHIDEKISLYEATNAQIEEHINDVVSDYKSYENDTYEKFDGSNGTEVVSLYPELKTNELIQGQMEVYYENQQNILSLKSQKIDLKPCKWWLYFGG